MGVQCKSFLAILICLLAAYKEVSGDVVHQKGEEFTMSCVLPQGTMFVTWQKIQANYSAIVAINQNLEAPFAATGRMAVTMLEEGVTVTYSLTVTNLHLEDSGTYSCHSGLNTSTTPVNQMTMTVHEAVQSVQLYYRQSDNTLKELQPTQRFELANGAPCTFICSTKGSPEPEVEMVLDNHEVTLVTQKTTVMDIQGDPVRAVGLLRIQYQVNLTSTQPSRVIFPGNSTILHLMCTARSHQRDAYVDKKITIYQGVTGDGRKVSGSYLTFLVLSLMTLAVL